MNEEQELIRKKLFAVIYECSAAKYFKVHKESYLYKYVETVVDTIINKCNIELKEAVVKE